MSRSYRPAREVEFDGRKELEDLAARIAIGKLVPAEEMLPYLCLGGKAQRAEVNAMLADAYLQTPNHGNLRQARVFIQRAWLLSNFSADLLPLYVKIAAATNNVEDIRNAYKRVGMKASDEGDASQALQYFTSSQYAYHVFKNIQKYQYDFDILDRIDDLAAPYRFYPPPRGIPAPANDEKVRVAYLLKGIQEVRSNLIEINLEFARLHDKSRFDVTFFTPESDEMIAGRAQSEEQRRAFEKFGYRVVTAPNLSNRMERLLGLARKINESRPHLMVTSTALADADHYFITSLRPAPVVIGLIQGPPALFAPPALDWGIVWSRHPLMDSPVDCTHIRLLLDSPAKNEVVPYSKSELGIPEDARLLMSGGSFPKFQSPDFWKTIGEVLAQHPDTFYLAVGPKADEIPFLEVVLPRAVRERVLCLGWREDVLKILAAADLVIDTYPSGGGLTLIQAMAAGIPVVSQRNDYMKLYDQTDWSPAEDFIDDPEIVVPRGDIERFKQAISKLLGDELYRRQVGERCRAQHVSQANPERAVRQCEETYLKVLERFSS